MSIKIAIAEDNVFLIHAIKEKIAFFDDFEVTIEALDGQELLEKMKATPEGVDVILMDIQMPQIDGIAATQQVKQLYPTIKVIMLTVFDDYQNIFQAIKAGANGYLLKEVNPDELHEAIIQTMNGGAGMHPQIAKKAMELLRKPPEELQVLAASKEEPIQLTKRETEVLEQLSKGFSHTEIAKNLYRSPKTIRNHMENIYKKLQVHSKLEAVLKAKNNFMI